MEANSRKFNRMKITRNKIGILLGSLSIVCILISYFILYKAGCAGDSKGGSYGNPMKSIEIESNGISFLFAASIFIASSFGVLIRVPILLKILIAVFLAVLSFVVFFLFGMEIEGLGIQNTFGKA
jgi:hypothetical protein